MEYILFFHLLNGVAHAFIFSQVLLDECARVAFFLNGDATVGKGLILNIIWSQGLRLVSVSQFSPCVKEWLLQCFLFQLEDFTVNILGYLSQSIRGGFLIFWGGGSRPFRFTAVELIDLLSELIFYFCEFAGYHQPFKVENFHTRPLQPDFTLEEIRLLVRVLEEHDIHSSTHIGK